MLCFSPSPLQPNISKRRHAAHTFKVQVGREFGFSVTIPGTGMRTKNEKKKQRSFLYFYFSVSRISDTTITITTLQRLLLRTAAGRNRVIAGKRRDEYIQRAKSAQCEYRRIRQKNPTEDLDRRRSTEKGRGKEVDRGKGMGRAEEVLNSTRDR